MTLFLSKNCQCFIPQFIFSGILAGALIPVLAVLFLLGCLRGNEKVVATEALEEPFGSDYAAVEIVQGDFSEETALIAKPRFAIIPAGARPGEPVAVGFSDVPGNQGERKFQAVLLDPRGRRLAKAAFFDLPGEEKLKAAVLAIPSTALIGNAFIRIESGDDTIQELPFTIENREFRSETIPLNQVNTDLRTQPDPQKTAESEHLWTILSRAGTEIYSFGPFTAPATSSRRTSAYGSRRVYEYADGKSDTTIHFGVDIGVPTGTEVRACGQGKVVLARERIVTGNTIVLEHMPGLYSLYYHMDSIAVSEGSVIEAETLLGESGSTGLATGPHLHWEIRVSGENADPDVFLSRPVLDKQSIIDRLTEY
jgi:murein DD-endopeptidase MepM/ murein hydrolase activator NlpD